MARIPIEPFDESDRDNITAEKYRRIFLARAERAVKDGGRDEYAGLICGTFTALAQAHLSHGVAEADLEAALRGQIIFAIVQATHARVWPAGADEFFLRNSAEGAAN